MTEIFMCLLLQLTKHGKLTEATMYKGGEFSVMSVKTDNGIYKVSISKETEQETDGNS